MNYVENTLIYATGRLFVDKHFQEDKKHMVRLILSATIHIYSESLSLSLSLSSLSLLSLSLSLLSLISLSLSLSSLSISLSLSLSLSLYIYIYIYIYIYYCGARTIIISCAITGIHCISIYIKIENSFTNISQYLYFCLHILIHKLCKLFI